MNLDDDRFIFRRIGRHGKKSHVFLRAYSGRSLCFRGPGNEEPSLGVKKEKVCKECLKEYHILKHSPSYVLFG